MEKIPNKMKTINLYVCSLLFFMFVSCNGQQQKQKTVEKEKSNETKSKDMTEQILEKQLKTGVPTNYDFNDLTEKDLEAIIPVLKDRLKENGFKFLDNATFAAKIKEIFGRVIDPASATKFLYADFMDRCNKKINYHENNADYNGIYILKNESFITELFAIPQVLDYQKKYPQSSEAENEKIIINDEIENTKVEAKHWKDVPDLAEKRKRIIQVLVARNMYLFNDSKAHANWIAVNDKDFARNLVKVFGFTKEPKFNQLALSEYLDDPKNIKMNNGAIGDLIVVKNCAGELEIRSELLNEITATATKNNSKIVKGLEFYLIKQSQGQKMTWTKDEKRKVYAHFSNYRDELYIRNEKERLSIDLYPNTLMAQLLASDKGAEEFFAKNNNFGLSNLKTIIDYAKKEKIYE